MSIITEENGYYFPKKVENDFKKSNFIEDVNQDDKFNGIAQSKTHQKSKIDWDIINVSNKKEMELMDFAKIFLRKKKISNKPPTKNEKNENEKNEKQPNLKSQLHISNDMSEDDDYELIELIPTETKSQMSSKYQFQTSLGGEDEDNRMKDDDEKETEKENEKKKEKEKEMEKEMERQKKQDMILEEFEKKKDKDFYEQKRQAISEKGSIDDIREKELQRRRDRDEQYELELKNEMQEREEEYKRYYEENEKKRRINEINDLNEYNRLIKEAPIKEEEMKKNLERFSLEAKRIKSENKSSPLPLDVYTEISKYFNSQKDYTNLQLSEKEVKKVLKKDLGIKNFVIYVTPKYEIQLIESGKVYYNVKNLKVDTWRRDFTTIFPRLERLTVVYDIDIRMRKKKIKLFPESITHLELLNQIDLHNFNFEKFDKNDEYNNFPLGIISLRFEIWSIPSTLSMAKFVSKKIYNSTTIKDIVFILRINVISDDDYSFLTGFFNLGAENSKLESIKISIDENPRELDNLIEVISESIISPRSNLKKLTLENVQFSLSNAQSSIGFFDSFNNRNCKITNLEIINVGHLPENAINRIANSISGINCNLISIKFTRGFFPFGFGVLANSLKHPNCKITSIDLSLCHINTVERILIAEVLKDENCKLTSLTLESIGIEYNMLTKLSESIEHPNCKLIYLDLYYNGLVDITPLTNSLKNKNCKLTFINLGYNIINETGVRAIEHSLQNKNCKLTSIILKRLQLTYTGMLSITEALKNENCKLTHIDLSYPRLNLRGADYLVFKNTQNMLFKSFRNENFKPTSINLNGFDIDDGGAEEISTSLKDENCKLTSIELKDNRITDVGALMLLQAFENKNCKLTSVDLSENKIGNTVKGEIIKAVMKPRCTIKFANLKL
jgi:hypothetical protein